LTQRDGQDLQTLRLQVAVHDVLRESQIRSAEELVEQVVPVQFEHCLRQVVEEDRQLADRHLIRVRHEADQRTGAAHVVALVIERPTLAEAGVGVGGRPGAVHEHEDRHRTERLDTGVLDHDLELQRVPGERMQVAVYAAAHLLQPRRVHAGVAGQCAEDLVLARPAG
jgi:hypothetical protein